MRRLDDIVLIGAGKVAGHLGRRLREKGHHVRHVHGRTAVSTAALARVLDADHSTRMEKVPPEAELYLIAVPDDVIGTVAAKLAEHVTSDALVLHTSGATPSDVLAPHFRRYGVFYPLQTFSVGRPVDFARVPLCLYTAVAEDYPPVAALAAGLVNEVYAVDDRQRAGLHLAAVFVNNFTNYLQFISRALTEANDLPWYLLRPLLRETVAKLEELTPREAQTGPAVRDDQATLRRHLELLSEHPEWAEIYRLLSRGIQKDLGRDR